LSQGVIVHVTRNGELAARTAPDFQAKLERRIAVYLKDPTKLVTDLSMIEAIVEPGDDRSGEQSAENDILLTYGEKMILEIVTGLTNTAYTFEDFSPKVVAKWMKFAEELPADTDPLTPEGLQALLANEDSISFAQAALLAGQAILSKTLQAIASSHPREMIDTMYMVADIGLDPNHRLKRLTTLNILNDSLVQAEFIRYILSWSVGASQHRQIQRRAIDLRLTLVNLGVPHELLTSPREELQDGFEHPISLLGDRADMLNELYPSDFYRQVVTPDNLAQYDKEAEALNTELIGNFWKFVNTRRGKRSTLYGRFLAADQAEEREGRK
jgi:hypothetical protein